MENYKPELMNYKLFTHYIHDHMPVTAFKARHAPVYNKRIY